MESCQIVIVTRSKELPAMECKDFFHSTEMFHIWEQTPGSTPYMVIAQDANGVVHAHLLAVVNRRGSMIPPYLYSVGRIYGEGEYADDAERPQLFRQMLRAITTRLKRRLCLYIEVSHISKKMFGYRTFRENDYFPIRWLQVHNSLHSKPPVERLDEKMKSRIAHVQEIGVTCCEATTQEETDEFYKILRNFYRFKFQRFIPKRKLFEQLQKSPNSRIYTVSFKKWIIGGCAVVYSRGNAYLWYIATKRKSFAKCRPTTMTIWHALQDSYERGFDHLHFMNVGLPYSKNPIRETILHFGGKPASTNHWFRCSIGWVNRLLKWFYRE
ncbi:MAG: GNAT family N-acetyltransferase [Prevotella sp.]|nr:GNAT family N-acetyltransferase [Prevotella sp.]